MISIIFVVLLLTYALGKHIYPLNRDKGDAVEPDSAISNDEYDSKQHQLAVMAHEIRSPLAGMIGLADILGDTNLDETQRQYRDLIYSTGNSLCPCSYPFSNIRFMW